MKKSKRKAPKSAEHYVVGRREDGFCWLLPAVAGQQADDQTLETAERLSSLSKAIAASTEYNGNVFEIMNEDGKLVLHEIMVDRDAIKAMPYDGCYELLDELLAGPSFVCNQWSATQERILRLAGARVECIISLVSKGELFWARGQLDRLWFDELFRQHYFPIADRSVPTPDMMVLILNTIDRAIEQNQKTFLHCIGGRGRTGLVAACFAVRHGVATGESAINFIAKRRYQFGLFEASPESKAQREFVKGWKEGQ